MSEATKMMLAQQMFHAYRVAAVEARERGAFTPIGTWEQLAPDQRAGWKAAAEAAYKLVDGAAPGA